MASGPYGIPNFPKESREVIALSCSGVRPALGNVNSVRTRVWVRGAEMDCREIWEGEVMWCKPIVLLGCPREDGRRTDDSDVEPLECVDRWENLNGDLSRV